MKKLAVIVISLLGLLISQCSNSISPSKSSVDNKSVSVSFAITTNSQFKQIAKKAFVKVSASDMEPITVQMSITDSTLRGSVSNIPIGDLRKFEIFVYDSANIVRYYGSQSVNLSFGVPTNVTIILSKVSGPIEVIGLIKDTTYYNDSIPAIDTNKIDTTYRDTTWIKDTIPGRTDSIQVRDTIRRIDSVWVKDSLPNDSILKPIIYTDTIWNSKVFRIDTLYQIKIFNRDTLQKNRTIDTIWLRRK